MNATTASPLTTLGFGKVRFNDKLMRDRSPSLGNGNCCLPSTARWRKKVQFGGGCPPPSSPHRQGREGPGRVQPACHRPVSPGVGYENRALAPSRISMTTRSMPAISALAIRSPRSTRPRPPAPRAGCPTAATPTTAELLPGKQDGEMAFVRLRCQLPDGNSLA